MRLRADAISATLSRGSLFAGKILVEDSVDSTNTQLKAMAAAGAPVGTVLLAEEQTAGRGTRGRSFCSPRGEGLYLSVLLRPEGSLREVTQLTGWAAVAARRGVERASGAPVEIKWLNDLYLNGRKVCGILSELSLDGGGRPDYVVVGIGVNAAQRVETFRSQGLEGAATSLGLEGYAVDRNHLCVCLLEELERLCREFPRERSAWLDEYRKYCLTAGREVTFEEGGRTHRGTALGVDDEFALEVRGEDGTKRTVFSGTVSLVLTE